MSSLSNECLVFSRRYQRDGFFYLWYGMLLVTWRTLKMLKRYAITIEDFPKKNTPRSHVVPNRQVNTAHALTQYLV